MADFETSRFCQVTREAFIDKGHIYVRLRRINEGLVFRLRNYHVSSSMSVLKIVLALSTHAYANEEGET